MERIELSSDMTKLRSDDQYLQNKNTELKGKPSSEF